MIDIIIVAIIVILVAAACGYIWKEKKKGRKCIGCSYSGCKSCSCQKDQKESSKEDK